MTARFGLIFSCAMLAVVANAGPASAQSTANQFYKQQAQQAEQRRQTNANITNSYIQQQRYNATRPSAPPSYYKPPSTSSSSSYKPPASTSTSTSTYKKR